MSSDKDRFTSIRDRALSFDGMMGEISVALFFALMNKQKSDGVHGNMIEFGVYRGRSASVLLSGLSGTEKLCLVDVADYPQLDRLKEISPNFEFIRGKSEDMHKDGRVPGFVENGVRLSHHDASHTFANLTSELKLVDGGIKDGGIVILDDFGNWHFAQVVAAFFHHIYTTASELEIFLVAENKAYICKKRDFNTYAEFVLTKLLPLLADLGLHCYIGRTDKKETYRGFALYRKRQPSDDDFYATKTYGNQFYKI